MLLSSWRDYLRWAAGTAVLFGIGHPLLEDGHVTVGRWAASAIGFFLTATVLGLLIFGVRGAVGHQRRRSRIK